MTLKYFGILKNLNFKKLTEEEQLQILVDRELYTIFTTLSLKNKEIINFNEPIDIESSKDILKPSEELKTEFNLFILSLIKNQTDKKFFLFFKEFDGEIFGMNKKSQKKIALKYFKKINSKIDDTDFTFIYKNVSKSGIENSKTINKFIFLKYLRTGKLSALMTGENLDAYLVGDANFFHSNLLKEQISYIDLLDFENNLKILLSLNDRYKFQENNSFTRKTIAQKIYEDYQEDFESLLQLQFIEKQIFDSKKVNRAFILSIFHFFKKELSINTPTAQLFGEIVNSYFNFDFGKLKENSSISSEHDKRVDKFKKDWKNFLN